VARFEGGPSSTFVSLTAPTVSFQKRLSLRHQQDTFSIVELQRFALLDSIEKITIMSSKSQSANGSESEFEFIETPKAPTPTFEKFEDCGVRTTSVR
jgi:hypothetical protein